MKVGFHEDAEADLEAIGDYIAEDNPRRALSFMRELRQSALTLAEFPQAFPLVPRYEEKGIRRKPYRDYLIFCMISTDQITILHILRSA